MPKAKEAKPEIPPRTSRVVKVLMFNRDMKIPGNTYGSSLKASAKHRIEHIPASGGFPAKFRVYYNAGDVSDELDIEGTNVATFRYE